MLKNILKTQLKDHKTQKISLFLNIVLSEIKTEIPLKHIYNYYLACGNHLKNTRGVIISPPPITLYTILRE